MVADYARSNLRGPNWAASAPGARRRGLRLRKRVTEGGAIAVVIALHAAMFFVWRSTKPPMSALRAADVGAGGISLSLVRGRSGSSAGDDSGQSLSKTAEQTLAAAPAQEPSAAGSDAPMPSADTGRASSSDETASAGGPANDDGGGARASAGGGSDPWARASLAPSSFAAHSEPGLLEQVRRCLGDGGPKTPLTLAVMLDSAGNVIATHLESVDGLGGPEAAAARDSVSAALNACAPYKRLAAGASREVMLVVPGAR